MLSPEPFGRTASLSACTEPRSACYVARPVEQMRAHLQRIFPGAVWNNSKYTPVIGFLNGRVKFTAPFPTGFSLLQLCRRPRRQSRPLPT